MLELCNLNLGAIVKILICHKRIKSYKNKILHNVGKNQGEILKASRVMHQIIVIGLP